MARQVVVTCAHVVRRSDSQLQVEWLGVAYETKVLAREREDFPDLCFLGLTDALDHQYLHLEEANPKPGSKLAIFGHSRYTPERGAGKDGVRMTVTGQHGRFIKVSGGRLVPGLSGAPVVDKDGQVIGVAKAKAVGYDEASGEAPDGWVVPASEVLRCYYQNNVQHRAELAARPTLIRPDQGSRLRGMLTAQSYTSSEYPYRIAKQLTHRPVPLLSMVYVEPRVNWRSLDAASINPIQMLRKHRHALVVAGPGGGKSTLLQQLVARSAQWWLRDDPPQMGAQPDMGPVVALRVAATDLLRQEAWANAIARAVNTELGVRLRREVKPDLFDGPPVAGAEWLLLVDGLDEVLSRDQRIKLISVLGQRVSEYGSAFRFGVASRRLDEFEFDQLREGLTEFDEPDRLGEYQIRPFSGPMLATFADRWFRPKQGVAARVTPESFLQNISDSKIRPLVEVPLMATIAAIVHEENPDDPLAEDRAGLYEQFVTWLLTARQQRLSAREALIEHLGDLDAEEVGEFLFARRYDCLAYLADRRLRDDQRNAETLVSEWLSLEGRALPRFFDQSVLREFLLSTGLVEIQGRDLQFIHRSLAEFLAAKVRVDAFDPARWLQRMTVAGPDSIGMFTATEWRRAGNDIFPVLEQLIEERDLDSLATLLQDGVTGERSEEVIQLAVDQVTREGTDVRATDPVHRLFRAILQRGHDRTVLPQLLAGSKADYVSRIEAAKVLLAEGNSQERAEAAGMLAHMAYGPEPDRKVRLRAISALAEAGEDNDRIFALQHLTHLVETHAEESVRAVAIVALAQVGEHAAAIMALLRRSCQPGGSLKNRLTAMSQLDDLIEYAAYSTPDVAPLPGPYAPAWHSTDTVAVGPRDATYDDVEQMFLSRLVGGLAASVRFDREGTVDIVRVFMRDRTHSPDTKFKTIVGLQGSGLHDLAREAAAQFAADPLEPGGRRVAAMWLLTDDLSRTESVRTLRGWIADPRQDLDVRHAALRTVAGYLSDEELIEIVEDPHQAIDIRLSALTMGSDATANFAWALSRLALMARDFMVLSPVWCRIQLLRFILSVKRAARVLIRSMRKQSGRGGSAGA